MAGILNNRSRLIDTIITDEGKRQMANGDLRIEYASYTDGAAFYESDVASGSSDAGNRIYFEAISSPNDVVTFESDDSGRLVARRGLQLPDISIVNGKLAGSLNGAQRQFITGSDLQRSGSRAIRASLESFKGLRVIGSAGPFEEESEFILSVNSGTFNITDSVPIDRISGVPSRRLDTMGDLFSDERLTHAKNLQYLPPVNASPDPTIPATPLANYLPLGRANALSSSELLSQISEAEDTGNVIDVEFTETSLSNNLLCQFFEITTSDLRKLDIIEYGTFTANDSSSRHVFFAGKLYTNSYGVHTFVHIFTLMFYDQQRSVSAL